MLIKKYKKMHIVKYFLINTNNWAIYEPLYALVSIGGI